MQNFDFDMAVSFTAVTDSFTRPVQDHIRQNSSLVGEELF